MPKAQGLDESVNQAQRRFVDAIYIGDRQRISVGRWWPACRREPRGLF